MSGTARAKFEAAIQALPQEANLLRRSLFFYRGLCLQKLGRHEEASTSILNAIDAGFRPETSEEALVAGRTRFARIARVMPFRFLKPSPQIVSIQALRLGQCLAAPTSLQARRL